MKTSTKKATLKRLNELTVKSESNIYPLRKNSRTYKFVMEFIEGAKVIRPCYVSGSGRNIKNNDFTNEVREALSKLGLKYRFDNDAPRNGLTGNYIEIITKIK